MQKFDKARWVRFALSPLGYAIIGLGVVTACFDLRELILSAKSKTPADG